MHPMMFDVNIRFSKYSLQDKTGPGRHKFQYVRKLNARKLAENIQASKIFRLNFLTTDFPLKSFAWIFGRSGSDDKNLINI